MNYYLFQILDVTHLVSGIITVLFGVALIIGLLVYSCDEYHSEEDQKAAKKYFKYAIIGLLISLFYVTFVPSGFTYREMYEEKAKIEQRK